MLGKHTSNASISHAPKARNKICKDSNKESTILKLFIYIFSDYYDFSEGKELQRIAGDGDRSGRLLDRVAGRHYYGRYG